MASDDLTQQLPEDEDKTTQPTIVTVLERMQRFEERMAHDMEELAGRLERHTASEIASLREEMNRNFRRIENKIQLLNEDTLNMRENQRDALQRISDLESKAS